MCHQESQENPVELESNCSAQVLFYVADIPRRPELSLRAVLVEFVV
jgi:hypothetical protein